jgi:phosphohistidine swiveling domain-containing protein
VKAGDWYRASSRPVSRLARASYRAAGAEDARMGRGWHGFFQRRVDGPWLLARRLKKRGWQPVEATSALGFLARWAVGRRRKLCLTLALLPRWWQARGARLRRARRVMGLPVRTLADHALAALLRRTWADHLAIRRVHAGLWYPVDLLKDLREYGERFAWPGASLGLARPRLRQGRDRHTRELVASIREAHGGEHPPPARLSRAERLRVVRHLQRYPHAFASADEVQDLANWSAASEDPDGWWEEQAGVTVEPASPSAAVGRPGPCLWLAATPMRLLVAPFASAKDDRVEVLATNCAALRRLCLDLQRRAGGGDEPWVFELEPEELLQLAAQPTRGELLRSRARRRWRERERLSPLHEEREPSASPAPGGPLIGRALAAGRAQGRARVVATAREAQQRVKPGDVLVTDEVRPAFTLAVAHAAAFVFRHGSALCHGAIVARERGIPAVALGDQLDAVRDGAVVEVDGQRGVVTPQ